MTLLAPEIDAEFCRVAAAAGVDLQLFVVGGSATSIIDLAPAFDVLRGPLGLGLDEHRQRLAAELLRRVEAGIWRLRAAPFSEDQLTGLVPENLDIATSEIILGGRRLPRTG